MLKYLRHFPLAAWALLCLVLGGVLAVAQWNTTPTTPTRSAQVQPIDERANAMALLTHLAAVHAAAAPPASGLVTWAADTATIAQAYADRRAASVDDNITQAYRDVAAAAIGLTSVDLTNREQILTGISALGAAGIRLGAAVNGLSTLPAQTDATNTPTTTSDPVTPGNG